MIAFEYKIGDVVRFKRVYFDSYSDHYRYITDIGTIRDIGNFNGTDFYFIRPEGASTSIPVGYYSIKGFNGIPYNSSQENEEDCL